MHRKILAINPLALSSEQSYILAHFLNSQNLDEIKVKDIFQHTIPGKDFAGLEFNHRLVRRKRDRDDKEYVYDIIGDQINKGGQGLIHTVLGTLHYQNRESCYLNTNVKRLAKEGRDLTHEYELANKTGVLSVKKPVILEKDVFFGLKPTRSMMTMRLIPGEPLDKILSLNKLQSVEMRLNLAVEIIRAVRKYIHRKNITHCDLKESNIMVDLNRNPIGVKIIDMGASKSENNTPPIAWTPAYCPPEFFKDKTFTQDGDIFSLGAVLSLVFGADEHPITLKIDKILSDPKKFKEFKKHEAKINEKLDKQLVEEAKHRKFKNLFNNVDGLSKEHKHLIAYMLAEMVSKKMDKRISLIDAIGMLEKIINERQIDQLSGDARQWLSIAFQCAAHTRNKLDDCAALPINAKNIDEFLKMTEHDFEYIQNTPQSIAAYLRGLGSNYLINETNAKDCTTKLDKLWKDFVSHEDKFKEISKDIELLDQLVNEAPFRASQKTVEIDRLLKDLHHESTFFNHKIQGELSIDNIHAVNEKLAKFNQGLEEKIKSINDYIPILEQLHKQHLQDIENNMSLGAKAFRFFSNTVQYYMGTPPVEPKSKNLI